MATKKNKVNYKDLNLAQLKILGEKGWPLTEIAAFYGIPYSTLQSWIERYKTIGDAINEGTDQSCDRVERALFEKAIGYEHEDTKFMSRALGGNMGSVIETLTYIKRYVPDTPAGIFYLTNKRRHLWKHRMELTADTGMNRLPDMSNLGFSQVMELAYGSSANTKKKIVSKKKQDEIKEEVIKTKAKTTKTTRKKNSSSTKGNSDNAK